MDQYIGRLLDNRYEILELIGTGGMAVVYKARCHRLNRLVAIKILKDEFSGDEEFRRRFHAEGEAVAMLSHPNIVQVYDVSSSANANYIVMELIDGITLKQYMEKKGVLNWKETLHFATQIGKALEHAHSRSIVHRDIKPHNVMVLKNGSVKVTDFGIARVMSKSNTLTKEALGSVHYISPEQAKGGWVDNRSDIYSLGVVMYEMMSGRPPYDGESPVAVAIKHINGGAPMPSSLNPNIPGGLEYIIMKAMALDVKDRYVSATEMLRDMEAFRQDPTILFGVDKTLVDEATRILHTAAILEASRQPRTTAERVQNTAAGASGAAAAAKARNAGTRANPSRAGESSRVAEQSSRSASHSRAKTRQEIREEIREEERNRTATIAVIACSAVAIIAIIIFLVALVNGALLGEGNKKVTVPNLLGLYYETMEPVAGLRVELEKYAYDETVEAGRIIAQHPVYGEKVSQNSVVKVTVSSGKKPADLTIQNLAGMKQENAENYLRDLGLVPLPREEFHDDYEVGVVTRTDPGPDVVLQPGQTITLYISKGPIIETQSMPNVVGQNYATAYNILTDMGFTNVRYEEEESDAPEGKVIAQSVERNQKVDVTEEIVLTVSKGPKPTEEPTEEPTERPTDPPKEEEEEEPTEKPTVPKEPVVETVTVRKVFKLPEDRTEDYLLGLYQNGRQVIEDTVIKAGQTEIEVTLTGSGVQYYELYINDKPYKTEKVEFTVNG